MKHLPILLILVAGACKKSVDSKDFESRIQKRTEELGMTGAKVSCPKGVEAKEGNTIECQVELGGKTYALVSTITKVDGKQLGMDTKWKDGEAVITAKLEPVLTEALKKEFATDVTIKCGDPLRFLDKDRNVTCDMAAGDTKAKALITFDDKLVPTKWALDPKLVSKAKLEQVLTPSVREKTSPGVAVTCGNQPLMPRPADGFVWCDIAEGDKQAKIKVEVDEDLNIKRWDVATP